MPMTMEDRDRGFEAKFAHDQEFLFRLHARRDKLMARWAAARLDLPDAETELLVTSVLHIADGGTHDGTLLSRISELLTERGRPAAAAEIGAALFACEDEARRQLLASPDLHPGAG